MPLLLYPIMRPALSLHGGADLNLSPSTPYTYSPCIDIPSEAEDATPAPTNPLSKIEYKCIKEIGFALELLANKLADCPSEIRRTVPEFNITHLPLFPIS